MTMHIFVNNVQNIPQNACIWGFCFVYLQCISKDHDKHHNHENTPINSI